MTLWQRWSRLMTTNSSGIMPVEFNVLVDPDPVSEFMKGSTVIRKPLDVLERDHHAQTRGKIVAMSPMAFNADVWPDGQAKPEVGQAIAFARHAGTFCDGLDGKEYRIIKDKDVVALIGGAV
jgi:co-chaperonin GroES (HSP10)